MKIGITGLGLIGGSMAKAIKETKEHTVYGYDTDESTLLAAELTDAIDGMLSEENLSECDVVIVSLYPEATVDYIIKNADKFKKDCIVFDCCGVKRAVCDRINPVAKEHGFTFIGGHPMAGTQFWGFVSSRASLFKGASMILTPCGISDIAVLDKAKHFFLSLGFSEITFSSPEEHDRIIAYTSQLAHVVSSAYVKSPSAEVRKGFSAGSYKDMTRVAKLNEEMWTELFLENKDNLAFEIDTLIKNLQQYKTALENADSEKLSSLLTEGKAKKKQVG
ncbi:MAG: prephenate dehydrogenase/arogenate dehydrogenase family protein [Clostridia bacterium]|nr:prephenate dehydrogenase/arogenate dehydrogenase family protein [Clostridia bacterium]